MEFTDRYEALGMEHPDPKSMCKGQCEGIGRYPVFRGPLPYDSTGSAPTAYEVRAWDEEHEEREHECDGTHFIICGECGGTGMAPTLRERLAAVAHEMWRGWMAHLFTQAIPAVGGRVILPAHDVERWKRLTGLPYAELTSEEQESDRAQADRMLAAVREEPQRLTFAHLAEANQMRLPEFRNARGEVAHSSPDGSDWTIAEWTNAVAGEAGEACNIAKKMRRGDFGAPGGEAYVRAAEKLLKELADVVIYADITARQAGGDLDAAVAAKFNEVSERIGSAIRLAASR